MKNPLVLLSPEEERKYFKGPTNVAIRYYYYLEQGLNILNEFRNLFLAIFAFYFALKLDNIWLLVIMFIFSCIILTIVGFFAVHRVAKIKEWINLRFSSHFGIRQYDFQKDILTTLKEIRDKM